MKQVNTLFRSLQSFICRKEISEILEMVDYRNPARKFTVQELLKYWIASSIEKWSGFRDSEDKMKSHTDLVAVDYSTLSKKASEVPYSFFKELFHLFLGKCNRSTLRKLDLPILATDSTTMTVGVGRLPWAYYRDEKAGVKLHVSFDVTSLLPKQVEESVALQHDSEVASQLLTGSTAIFICDRGYSKYERMDSLQEENHFFVIRLKKNTVISRNTIPSFYRFPFKYRRRCNGLCRNGFCEDEEPLSNCEFCRFRREHHSRSY
ncbi:IS4 family transposase [Paenactinomyces guangxiensis]|uniref:IS4 family transposase n=2 Tax=Paenactinomyces guangxiensis TaxID=1490290 RepID=A0A7W2A979_9BACL|nr:IS4 family transposase [Paenactinomyces guangxiensis]MBH8590865.1 IS4 family transposase [Paenactinomyces guangxiensis]